MALYTWYCSSSFTRSWVMEGMITGLVYEQEMHLESSAVRFGLAPEILFPNARAVRNPEKSSPCYLHKSDSTHPRNAISARIR